jgi:hypothetical protein
VNFPLSTYSVFGKKNVSREMQNISRSCRGLALSADGDKLRACKSIAVRGACA